MGVCFVIVVVVLLFLAACSSSKITLPPDLTEQPLFTDADLDKATVQNFTTTSVEALSEIDAANGTEVDESADAQPGEISAQVILPGATGIAITNPHIGAACVRCN